MSTNFPASIDTLTNPTATDDTSTVDHAAQHANANDAIEALEAKVGVNSSAVTSSLDYKVSNAASVDPGHKHTTAGLSITGTPDGTKFLKDDGSWSTPPTTTVATTSVTGTVKVSTTPAGDATAVETGDPRVPTQNENDALVGTSGTAVSASNKLVDAADVSAAAAADKIVRATGTALPALSGENLTNLPVSKRISSSTSDVTISNTTTETALASFTLPANSLSTSNWVDIFIPITDWDNQNGVSVTFRLKYGSTTVASFAITSQTGSNYTGFIRAQLIAAGSTSAQKGFMQLTASRNDDTQGDGTLSTFIRTGNGSATENSTSALTLQLTAQETNASTSDAITVGAYTASLQK